MTPASTRSRPACPPRRRFTTIRRLAEPIGDFPEPEICSLQIATKFPVRLLRECDVLTSYNHYRYRAKYLPYRHRAERIPCIFPA